MTFTLHSFKFDCYYCNGEIEFSRSEDETEEQAMMRHYRSPVHHEHHIHIDGEDCFCGIGPGYLDLDLILDDYRRDLDKTMFRW